MANPYASFTNIYVDPREKKYLYFCTGICASNVSVGKYNQLVQ